MLRRVFAIALLFATLVQGVALAYATTSGGSIGAAITHACGGQSLTDGGDCQHCAHHSMPSCAAQCSVPSSAVPPVTFCTLQHTARLGDVLPDPGVGRFTEHDPPHPFRPPIV